MNKTHALVIFILLASCSPNSEQTTIEQSTSTAQTSNVNAAELARWEQHAANVSISRDKWGIAHIYGKTDADTVFGTLYAQAEDDFNRVETNYLNAMGLLAQAEGADEIFRDLRMRLFINPEALKVQYDESPVWLQSLMNAFADGLNFYLHTHPQTSPRVIQRFEPWMALSFSEGSIGGDIERVNLQRLQEFYGEPSMVAQATAISDGEPRGSNGFAIAPQNTINGNALFLINPHTSFFFRSELHMVSEEGLNAYGAVTWGQFFIYQGFNENTGWMHTSSRADAIDEYLETIIEKEDGYYYQFGDEVRKLVASKITVPYKDGNTLSEQIFDVYHSHNGPIIRTQDDKWVSIALMQEPIKALTQSYTRTKAQNHEEFYATMELQTNSSNNTVYADSDGNIGYYHGNFVPRRNLEFDWNQPLDGSNPDTQWMGLHPVDETITLFNPANGWIQNTNNTPFNAAGEYSPKAEDYPIYMANNPENPRGIHAVKVLSGKNDFTLESLITTAYDSELSAFVDLIPPLLLTTAADEMSEIANPEVARTLEYIDLLRGWDYRYAIDSVETSLAIFWGQELMDSVRAQANSAGIDIYEYMANNSSASQKLSALRRAAQTLEEDFGSWQVPWGEINRYQRLNGDLVQDFNDDAPSLSVAFASSRWGSLASFGARKYPGTKKYYGTSGNSFVAVVEFGDRLRAKAITVGGLQNDPSLPHFDDQAQMYASGEFRDVLFYPEDIDANLEREYHPGE